MIFKNNKTTEKLGEMGGYVFAYLLFTTTLFLILSLTGRIPESWSYFHIMAVTLVISLAGIAIRRLLK